MRRRRRSRPRAITARRAACPSRHRRWTTASNSAARCRRRATHRSRAVTRRLRSRPPATNCEPNSRAGPLPRRRPKRQVPSRPHARRQNLSPSPMRDAAPERMTRPVAPPKPVAAAVAPAPNAASEAEVGNKLREMITSKQFDRIVVRKPDRDAIAALYQKGRSFQPLWVSAGRAKRARQGALEYLGRSTPTASIRKTTRCRSSTSAARKSRRRPS